MGLGSLPLHELSQKPLHLSVSGVCTLHRLLRVKAVKMAELQHRTEDAIERRDESHVLIRWKQRLGESAAEQRELQTHLPGVKRPSCDQSSGLLDALKHPRDQKEPRNDHERTVVVSLTT